MPSFQFPLYEHELFWRYYDRLYAFLAHCDYRLEKLELLNIVYQAVNCKSRTLLELWDSFAKNIDETCDFLDWLAWNTYKFKTTHFYCYIPSSFIPNYAPFMCEICYCSDHDSNSCPHYICWLC